MLYEQKKIAVKALDVDTTTRRVKIAFASLGNIDSDNDVFAENALDKSLKQHGPEGENRIWHLADHVARLSNAFGKFSEVGKQSNLVYGVSQYKDSWLWREVAWPLYEKGDITEHSIGFSTVNAKYGSAGERIITEATIFEGSSVIWGANPKTPTMEMVKSMTREQKIDHYIKEFDELINAVKAGKFRDNEDKELITLQLKQIQTAVVGFNKAGGAPDTKEVQDKISDEKAALLKYQLKEYTKKFFK